MTTILGKIEGIAGSSFEDEIRAESLSTDMLRFALGFGQQLQKNEEGEAAGVGGIAGVGTPSARA